MKRSHAFMALVALVGVGALGVPGQARADFEMMISWTSGGGGSMIIHDGGAGDFNPAAGAITYIGSAGQFSLTVNTGASKPAQGAAASPDMDLNVFVSKGSSSLADRLTIKISDTGFTGTGDLLHVQAGGTFGGNMNSVINQAFFDNNNTQFGTSGGSVLQTFTSSPFAGAAKLGVAGLNPYSLTELFTFDSGAGAASGSGDAELTTPAPAGLILALTGAPILAIGGWLQRRKAIVAV